MTADSSSEGVSGQGLNSSSGFTGKENAQQLQQLQQQQQQQQQALSRRDRSRSRSVVSGPKYILPSSKLMKALSLSLFRSINHSLNWSSSVDGQSSCETMSVALSEMGNGANLSLAAASGHLPGSGGSKSPEHLVNRKVLLERMGMTVDGTSDTQGAHSSRASGTHGGTGTAGPSNGRNR